MGGSSFFAGEELTLTIVKDKLRFLGFNGKVFGVI